MSHLQANFQAFFESTIGRMALHALAGGGVWAAYIFSTNLQADPRFGQTVAGIVIVEALRQVIVFLKNYTDPSQPNLPKLK